MEDEVSIPSHITHDLHFYWTVRDGDLNLWATLLNLTDKDPSFAGGNLNYDAYTHNPPGRILKLGFTRRF